MSSNKIVTGTDSDHAIVNESVKQNVGFRKGEELSVRLNRNARWIHARKMDQESRSRNQKNEKSEPDWAPDAPTSERRGKSGSRAALCLHDENEKKRQKLARQIPVMPQAIGFAMFSSVAFLF